MGNLDTDSPHLMLVYIEDLQDGWDYFQNKTLNSLSTFYFPFSHCGVSSIIWGG